MIGLLENHVPANVVCAFNDANSSCRELVDPEVIAQCERRLRATLMLRADEVAPSDAFETALMELCDHFALDVGAISDEHIRNLRQRLDDEGIHALLNAIYLTDMRVRLELVAKEIFKA